MLERENDGVEPLKVDAEGEEDGDGAGGVEHPVHRDHDGAEDVLSEPRPDLKRLDAQR